MDDPASTNNPTSPPTDPTRVTQPLRGTLEYAVKFICGRSGSDGCCSDAPVAPGHYYTAINVHNPFRETVVVRWKVAVALPGAEAGPVSSFSKAQLRYDEAMEIDCADIRCLAHRRDPFSKGFVIIQTDDVDLDVVAVYTAAGADHHVETLHTERVRPRRLGGPDTPTPTGMADLIPVWECRRGQLIVKVRNIGTANAGPSDTQVDFPPAPPVLLPTPPIQSGQEHTFPAIAIPPLCFTHGALAATGECQFTIRVDANSAVPESNEVNNTAMGKCPRG